MGDRISIIVPVYNTEKYLEKCLDSICNQSYKELEIILVECASKDESRAICRKYRNIDSRIVLLEFDFDKGIAWARKEGIDRATGEYFLFVDGDDWIENTTCEKMLTMAKTSKADVVLCSFYRDKPNEKSSVNEICLQKPGVYTDTDLKIFINNMIGESTFTVNGAPWSKLYSASLINILLKYYDDTIKQYGDDWEIVFPALVNAKTIYVSDEAFYHAVCREGSASKRRHDEWYDYMNKTFRLLRKVFSDSIYGDVLVNKLEQIYMGEILAGIKMVTDFEFPMWYLDKVDYKKRTIIYGAGEIGINCYRQFQVAGCDMNVKAWVDKYKYGKKLLEKDIEPVSVIDTKEYDQIIIANNSNEISNEIKQYLIGMGVDQEKIVSNKPVHISEIISKYYTKQSIR